MNKHGYIVKDEFISTMLLFTCLVVCFIFRNEFPELLNWLGYIILFYAIFTWRSKTKSGWFSAYSIFFTFFVLFNYGQPLMWAFNTHKIVEIGSGELFYGSGYTPSKQDLIDTQWYVCIGMLFFHFGALLLVKRKTSSQITQLKFGDDNYTNVYGSMRQIGGLLLCILSPIALYFKFQEVSIARLYGYKALYYGAYSTQSGYMQILMFMFFPAMVCYLIGSRYSKRAKTIVYTIFGLYALLGMMSGDRGSWLYSLVILIWLNSYYERVTKKKYIVLVVFSIIGIYLLSAITAVRNTGLSLTIGDLKEVFTGDDSPIVDTFFEMGGSMGIITFFLNRGEGIFPYDNTYLTAILGMFSSRVLSFFGIKQVLIADWFSQGYLRLNYGTGFSMIGEAFVNGGYNGGWLYMFIIGLLIGKLIQHTSKYYYSNSPLKLYISVAGLNAVIGFARGACYLTLKELFYGVALIAIVVYFLSERAIRLNR